MLRLYFSGDVALEKTGRHVLGLCRFIEQVLKQTLLEIEHREITNEGIVDQFIPLIEHILMLWGKGLGPFNWGPEEELTTLQLVGVKKPNSITRQILSRQSLW